MGNIPIVWIQLFYEFHNVCLMVINIIKPPPKREKLNFVFSDLIACLIITDRTQKPMIHI